MLGWVRERTDVLDRVRCYGELLRTHRMHRPVLVCSDAKTGTKSIAAAIDSAGLTTIHCHKITAYRGETARSFAGVEADRTVRPVPAWRGEWARFLMTVDRRSGPWQIVCGVRDPMARMVSSLFQVGEQLAWLDPGSPDVDLDPLVRHLADMVDFELAGPTWFEHELQAATGVDVFAVPFDRDAGSQVYEAGRFRVLLVRFEDLPRVAGPSLQTFLGLPTEPVLPTRNVGAEKDYAALYQRFRTEAEVPDRLLDALYGSRLARHFYDDAERAAQRARWHQGAER